MSASELFALLPLVALATGIVVVMLIAAFVRTPLNPDIDSRTLNHQLTRDHAIVARLSAIVLFITLVCLPYAAKEAPITVTPLLLIDGFSLLLMAMILACSLVVCFSAYAYWQQRQIYQQEFYLLLLIGTLGAIVLAAAQHFVSLLLGLEILGIALFAMTAYSTRSSPSAETSSPSPDVADDAITFGLEAGLKYLVLSGVASALLLFGMALLYLETGNLDFIGIARPLNGDINPTVFYAGIALLLAGIGFKLSLFPFHLWTPDVYQGAPAPVTAFIATVSKGAIFAVTLRFFVASGSLGDNSIVTVISCIAALSMVAGNWLALLQNNLKRLLAYSSIAHLGYLLIAFLTLQTINAQLAIEASAVYLAAYMATSLLAFTIVTLVSSEKDREVCELDNYRGLFWSNPLIATSFSIALLSLAGIPLTFGFIGKFYLFSVGAQAELWWLLLALIVGSGIGLFYYLRVITTLFKSPDISADQRHWHPGTLLSVDNAGSISMILILTVSLIIYGVYPQPALETIQQLSTSLVLDTGNLASN